MNERLYLSFYGMEKDKDKLIEYLFDYIKELKKKTNVKRLKENNIIKNSLFSIKLSKIIKNFEKIKFIEENIKQIERKNFKYSLLFESSRDGDTASKFHQLCDINAPVLIIKTTKNAKFGGYTTHILNGTSLEASYKDDKAFCFSVDKNKIYSIKKGGDTLCCCKSFCFAFYNREGDNIFIPDSFFKNTNTTCQSSQSEFEGMDFDFEINNGEEKFQVSHLEVYKIDFNNE